MAGQDAPNFGIFLEAHNAVYVEIAKVASSSVKIALAPLLGVSLEGAGGNPHKVAFPTVALDSRPSGAFVFAFVRNPWDRLVSCYRDKIGGEVGDFTAFDPERGVAHCLARFECFVAGMPFDDFVDAVAGIADDDADEHFRSQHCFLRDSRGVMVADFVGRQESLATGFREVSRRIGLPPLDLPRVQAAPPCEDITYYTPRTYSVVATRYRADIDLFGYGDG